MESDSSQLFPEVKKEQVPAPATERNEDQPRERVLDSDLMVKEGALVGIDQILDQTHEIASSALQFTLRREEIDKHYTTLENLLKGRTMEVELKEKYVMEQIVELEKKVEQVEERERKISLHEKSLTLRLEEKEKDNDVKQYLVSSLMRLVCEKANEEAVNELEERGKEVERISKCNDDKSSELDKAVEEFGLKQTELIEIRNKEAELVKESIKQLEAREKELGFLDEAIKEVTELEKKEEIFETEHKVKAEEMDLKSKEKFAELEKKEKVFEVEQKSKAEQMEVKEMKLEEREKELKLKQRELEEVMDELKERVREVERISKCNDDKSCELDNAVKEFDLKQKELLESKSKEAELVKESFKQLQVREKEFSVLDEAIKDKVTELEKRKDIFEAELKAKAEEMELKSKEMLTELEKKENIFEVKQKAKAEQMEFKEKKLDEREKELKLKQRELEEVMDELKERGKEVERISKCYDDKSSELDKAVEEFGLKQKELIESRRKEAELVKESLTKLEAREKELNLLDEGINEKVTELEKKKEIFETELKAKAEEVDLKSKEKLAELEEKEKVFEVEYKAKAKQMDIKKKKLGEREKELELKQKELEVMDELKERELQVRAETCKRPRVQFLAENGSEADSLIRPAKRHKSHSHDDADKETNSAYVVSASASSPEHMNKADKEENDEEPEQIKIVDSEFHDFKKTMSSFVVDKMWALYDPKDCMPRLYAKIKRVNKSRLSLDVTWVEPKDDLSVPVACGRFTYGRSGTVSHLAFSHELQPIIHGRNFIAVNPKEGETWALFRDWSESWDNNPVQHEPPYGYDLVEVVLGFNIHRGVGVSYLGKVKGFVSVFKRAAQHGVFQLVISPKEMHRFSHRVPSIRLNGEEKEGVPAGSYELDPAAVPSYILHGKTEADEVEVQDGSGEDVPIIID